MPIICELFKNVEEGEFFNTHDEPPKKMIKIAPLGIKHGGVNCYCPDEARWYVAYKNEAVVTEKMKI